ncbi:hypothetical protein [Bacteroides xylanisolvens]|uniref:hypothetical protein n=1 Tax=Bacteroides xylanisolvens TaxID=371601 RepID=UPI00125F536B|nr:hypothetical protein [Bacteroides xylanisolvens]KAB6342380.1 hypothetical protein GA160_19270 [Bacteroides xylanisolvens]
MSSLLQNWHYYNDKWTILVSKITWHKVCTYGSEQRFESRRWKPGQPVSSEVKKPKFKNN